MISFWRAASRAAAIFLWTGGMVAAYGATVLVSRPAALRLPRIWHRITNAAIGLDRVHEGQPADGRRVIYLVNHVSYLDILLLGEVLPASFIAKAEVARWPVIGWFARLRDTVFIERRAARVAGQRDELTRRLARGDSLVLFAEGTSSDGKRVLPFRSALFDAAFQCPGALLQPVSLAYTHVNGQPLDTAMRDRVAWYGDTELAGHLWALLGLGRIRAEILFHPTVAARDFASRKDLALACREIVAAGVDGIAARNTGPEPMARKEPDPDTEPFLLVWPPFD